MTTIVFAHPWHGSFNKAVLDALTGRLDASGERYTVLDLNKDGFNPVMTQEELSVYEEGKALDPLVREYVDVLGKTSKLIFVFPIWWYDMPAILRGFFDKVMLEGSAFHGDSAGMHPLLKIESSLLITSSFCSTKDLVSRFGDPINGTIIGAIFPALGIRGAIWKNLGGIGESTDDERAGFLKEVAELL